MDYSLYLVTDRGRYQGKDFFWALEEAVCGGVTMVQLREKDLSAQELVYLAHEVQEILRPHHIPLIINDHIEVAKKCGASGVHLGQQDSSPQLAREILGPGKVVGLSVENFGQLNAVDLQAVDYLGVGPIFPTATKADAAAAIGADELKKIVAHSLRPIVAIGGIQENNLSALAVIDALAGVAVASAIMHSKFPRNSAVELKKLWRNGHGT